VIHLTEQLGLDFDGLVAPLAAKPETRATRIDNRPLRDRAIECLAEVLAVSPQSINDALELLSNHSKESPAYIEFTIPKKSGGKRVIRAPLKSLKTLLRRIYLDNIKAYPLHSAAHGFRAHRTIVTCAKAHLGSNHMANWDIKDFFPSTPIELIKSAYEDTMGRTLRRSRVPDEVVDEMIEVLAKLSSLRCGESSVEILPVGAPTSPCLANHVLFEFDIHLSRLLKKLEDKYQTRFFYTRYGDDLTISSPDPLPNELFGIVPSLLAKYGYKVNKKKFKVMHRGGKGRKNGRPMEVTGLIIGGQTVEESRLLISDHTLHKYEMAIRRIVSDAGRSEKDVKILRGIIGITKMIYGPELAPRIVNEIKRLRDTIGASIVDKLIYSSTLNLEPTSAADEAEEIPDVEVEAVMEDVAEARALTDQEDLAALDEAAEFPLEEPEILESFEKGLVDPRPVDFNFGEDLELEIDDGQTPSGRPPHYWDSDGLDNILEGLDPKTPRVNLKDPNLWGKIPS